MSRTPRLITSVPYGVLVVGSLAATVAGGTLSFRALDTMTSTLLDGSATGVEVYAGQAIITLGAPILGAGLIGLALAVALAAAKRLAPSATAPAPAAEEEPEVEEEPGVEEELTAPSEPAAPYAASPADAVERDEAPAAR